MKNSMYIYPTGMVTSCIDIVNPCIQMIQNHICINRFCTSSSCTMSCYMLQLHSCDLIATTVAITVVATLVTTWVLSPVANRFSTCIAPLDGASWTLVVLRDGWSWLVGWQWRGTWAATDNGKIYDSLKWKYSKYKIWQNEKNLVS